MKSIFPPPFPADKLKTYNEIFTEPRVQIALVALLAVVLYFTKLGGTGLATWDDCYYAQKAKEILQTGDWLTMHYDGVPAFDNPPFFMWLIALSYKVFGVTEFAAKFPSALMGVLAVALTFVFVSYLYDNWIGFYAAFVLAATTSFAKYARHAMMDVTLTFFVVLALTSLILAVHGRKRYLFVWAVSIGACVLIKSVLGFFPLLISGVFLLATGNVRLVGSWQFLLSGLIVVVLGGGWYAHQYTTHGQVFIDVHFKWLIIQRSFEEEPQAWYQHLSYFKDLITYYWPWLPFSVFGLVLLTKEARRRNPYSILIIAWIVLYIGIMSIMQSRRVWYIMPVFPALAIASGLALRALIPDGKRIAAAKAVLLVLILGFLVLNVTPIKADMERQKDVRLIAPYVKYFCSREVELIAFRKDLSSTNYPLLFYSDHSARPIYTRASKVEIAFGQSKPVLCITDRIGMEQLEKQLESYYMIKKAQNKFLISNQNLDASAVR
jgi:4-amino-4-deoxy-L-arabinose transferase-like glycosyltransferase